MATPPPLPPVPGSIEVVGEKGAQEIVTMLTDVTIGKLDRDAAIKALITIYHYKPALAQAMVLSDRLPAPHSIRARPGESANTRRKAHLHASRTRTPEWSFLRFCGVWRAA